MMKAMLLEKLCQLIDNPEPLQFVEVAEPTISDHDVMIKVSACGVCHTELDEIEGRTPPPCLPVIPGHQVIGRIVECGKHVRGYRIGARVGVAWIYSSCRQCKFCLSGNENLCADFKATGRDVDGGYAQYMRAAQDFIYPIPERFTDVEAAPLLCAGAIGYRSLRLTNLIDGQNLGLTGFGASAHLVLMMARHRVPNSKVFVFARSALERKFAGELGAFWVGDTMERAPEKLAAIIDTTPVWEPVLQALQNLEAGGRLVINAIRKEEIDKQALLTLDYPQQLWMEKEIKSVANVARRDVQEFLQLASEIPIKPEVEIFSLQDANRALTELKMRKIRGAKVIHI